MDLGDSDVVVTDCEVISDAPIKSFTDLNIDIHKNADINLTIDYIFAQ